MKIQHLISTMNRINLDFLEDMNLKTGSVIVNQCFKSTSANNIKYPVLIDNIKHYIINSNETGLSNSRNLALENSGGEICIISDDDVIYADDYIEKIETYYRKYPEADIFCFQVERVGTGAPKKYYKNVRFLNYLTSMKVSSVEITFRKSNVINKGIKFNPYLGAGKYFFCGEENDFLYRCLDKNLKIIYIPISIGKTDVSNSSWFSAYNEQYFQSKGAAYYSMSRKLYPLLIFQFVIRKHKLFKNDMSFLLAIRSMFFGVSEYKKLVMSNDY